MTYPSSMPESQKNTASRGGVVYSGTFSGPVATATGHGKAAASVSMGAPDQLIKALRDQLAEARRSLEGNSDPAKTADCANAIREIDRLDGELADRQAGRHAGKLRRRLNRLMDILTPVAGIIGGTAAFLEIINDLKSVI